MTTPSRGDRYIWGGSVEVEVRRVAKDGLWADVFCYDAQRRGWTKRQPLPFPDTFVAVASDV